MERDFEKETEKYFTNYNEHYSKMQQWFYNHEKLLSKLNYKYCYYPDPDKLSDNVREKNESSSNEQARNNVKQRNRSQAYLLRKKAKKKLKRKQTQLERKRMNELLSNSSASFDYDDDNDGNEDEDDEEYEMHINEEMRQFFEISAKHREERNKALNQNGQSKQEKESQEATDTNTNDTKPDDNDIDHIEKPGEARMKEMKELYGEGAAKIHAMETAMQLTFNRNFDQKLPKLWPALPLNIKFD